LEKRYLFQLSLIVILNRRGQPCPVDSEVANTLDARTTLTVRSKKTIEEAKQDDCHIRIAVGPFHILMILITWDGEKPKLLGEEFEQESERANQPAIRIRSHPVLLEENGLG